MCEQKKIGWNNSWFTYTKELCKLKGYGNKS